MYTLIVKTELIPGGGLTNLLRGWLLRSWIPLDLGRLTTDQHRFQLWVLEAQGWTPDLFAMSATSQGRVGLGLTATAAVTNDGSSD